MVNNNIEQLLIMEFIGREILEEINLSIKPFDSILSSILITSCSNNYYIDEIIIKKIIKLKQIVIIKHYHRNKGITLKDKRNKVIFYLF